MALSALRGRHSNVVMREMARNPQKLIKRLFISNLSLLFLALLLSLWIGTKVVVEAGDTEPVLQASKVQPLELQQQESVKLFKQIYKLSSENNKANHLERITELYLQIIQNCPDAPLAQESHFLLIELFFNDYTPPLKEKAADLFRQFKDKYPHSRSMGVIKYAVAKGFFANKFWEDLVRLESSSVKKYFTTGKIDSPLSLFYYSEAKYNLYEFEAAVKGYSALVENFPDTLVTQIAVKKLAQIDEFCK